MTRPATDTVSPVAVSGASPGCRSRTSARVAVRGTPSGYGSTPASRSRSSFSRRTRVCSGSPAPSALVAGPQPRSSLGASSLTTNRLFGSVEDDDAAEVLATHHVVVAAVDVFELVGLRDQLVELDLTGVVERQDVLDVEHRVALAEQRALERLLVEREDVAVDLHGVLGHRAEAGEDDRPRLAGRVEGILDHPRGDDTDCDDRRVGADAERRLVGAGDRLLACGDGLGGTEVERLLALELDRVDRDDRSCTGVTRALHGVDADTTDAEDDDGVARADLGAVDSGAPAGRHAATDEGGLVERQVVVDLDDRVAGDDATLAERAEHAHAADVMAVRVATVGAVG